MCKWWRWNRRVHTHTEFWIGYKTNREPQTPNKIRSFLHFCFACDNTHLIFFFFWKQMLLKQLETEPKFINAKAIIMYFNCSATSSMKMNFNWYSAQYVFFFLFASRISEKSMNVTKLSSSFFVLSVDLIAMF